MNNGNAMLAIFAGIDPSQLKSALTIITRRAGEPDAVEHHRISSIIYATALAKAIATAAEGLPKERVFIALEYPSGAWGSSSGMAVVRAAAAAFVVALAEHGLKSRITRVAPVVWHSALGVTAMKGADPKARARMFAKQFVVTGIEELTQDEYDSACLAEYARRVLAIGLDKARSTR